MRGIFKRCAAFAAISLGATLLGVGSGQLHGRDAAELKAAFVYRLCHFVTWPQRGSEQVFVIGFVGETEVEQRLEALVAGKRIEGRPIEVRRFPRLSAMGPADVVFVASSHRRWTDRILGFYEGKPTLLVGEYEDFAIRGGTVALYLQDERLSLEINYPAAVEASLGVSSKLLAVAQKVIGRQ